MAIGWLSVLQTVPWTDVIRNAPKVAEGAKKLWSAVGGKPAAPQAGQAEAAAAAPPHTLTALEARVVALEALVSELQSQALASSELIKALADQNAVLVKQLETHRRWNWGLSLAAAAGAAALFYLLSVAA